MDDTNCKLTQEQIDELVQRGKAQNGVLTYGDVMGTINSLDSVSPDDVEHYISISENTILSFTPLHQFINLFLG